MDGFDRYLAHSRACGECKPATVKDPVCVPCPTGQQMWNRYQSYSRRLANQPEYHEGPSSYAPGGGGESSEFD